jgi:alkaline phosphatase D
VANVGIIGEVFMANNPHLKYDNLVEKGYLLLDITKDRVQGEYFFTGAPEVRSAVETFQRALIDTSGTNYLALGTTATTERSTAPALAP